MDYKSTTTSWLGLGSAFAALAGVVWISLYGHLAFGFAGLISEQDSVFVDEIGFNSPESPASDSSRNTPIQSAEPAATQAQATDSVTDNTGLASAEAAEKVQLNHQKFENGALIEAGKQARELAGTEKLSLAQAEDPVRLKQAREVQALDEAETGAAELAIEATEVTNETQTNESERQRLQPDEKTRALLEADKLARDIANVQEVQDQADPASTEKTAQLERESRERLQEQQASQTKVVQGAEDLPKKLTTEKTALEKLDELEKAAAEKLTEEKAATEKLAAEKLAKEKAATEKLAADKLAEEKAAAEKLAAEKLAKEKAAAEKLAAEKLAKEKAAAEKKLAAEKLAEEKAAAEKMAAEKLAEEKAAEKKLAAEKLAKEKAAAEKKLAAEKRAEEKAAAKKLATEKLANERLAAEEQTQEMALKRQKQEVDALVEAGNKARELAKELAKERIFRQAKQMALLQEQQTTENAALLDAGKKARQLATELAASEAAEKSPTKGVKEDNAVAAQTNSEETFESLRANELALLQEYAKGVVFKLGQWVLTEDVRKSLDRIFETLFLYSAVTVNVTVHSADSEDEIMNKFVGQQRARTIKRYLTDRGLEANRVSAAGGRRSAGSPKSVVVLTIEEN